MTETKTDRPKILYVIICTLIVLQVVSLFWLTYFQLTFNAVADSRCGEQLAPRAGDPLPGAEAEGAGTLVRLRRKAPNVKKGNGKRKARSDRHNTAVTTSSPSSALPQANVEFINPNLRDEFTSKSENDKENPWVWLNAYSRIPLFAIQEFCSATKEYCPAGPPGPVGRQGLIGERGHKGERGERGPQGDVGPRGPVGPPGPTGPRGPKGEIGEPGLPGLDGRDGIPGEPGLDGVPGRNGQDGLPGSNGIPGFDGMPGLPGKDGINGSPGPTGPQGESGPAGPSGLTGPRGKNGRPGLPGLPGIPGINTWMVNGTDAKRLLIPPSVLGSEANSTRPVVIKEGDNLRLRCAVAGIPRPEVSWAKADGSLIPMGSWKTSDIVGPTFNITKIHRDHMGTYVCIADNGVPPAAYRTFHVEVHFAPLIRTHSAMVGAVNGTSVILECVVEAFPESLCYWERSDGKIIENTEKRYSLYQRDFDKFKVQMTLNLTVTNDNDYGRYYCVSKNEIGITKGLITVYETDPHFATPPPTAAGTKDDTVWGPSPPDLVDLEDVCPPPPECPRCPALPASKCRDSGLGLFDVLGRLDIRPLGNNTYSGFTNRTQDCVISAIGKPVYYRFTDAPYGSWMKDAAPKTLQDSEKYWATRYNDSHHLYEYYNKTTFRKDVFQKNYTLPFAFKGHLHVVFNGSFYYHQQDESRIIRYELGSERTSGVNLPNATVTDNWYIYSQSQSYMDFAVDESGLWVIYGLQPNNNTAVAKLNPFTLDIEYVWNISLNNQRAGEMFIACGVLYAVDSVTEHSTKIRFALDLFKNKLVPEVELAFSNPFRKTTMVGYNPRTKELYTWDKGNQLSYPVKTVDAGYNVPENDAIERVEFISPEASRLVGEDDFENF